MQRRTFIKGAIVSNLLLASSFLLNQASAALPRDLFKSDASSDDAMKGLGASDATASDKITINAPELAENGANVPIEVISSIPETTQIALVIINNPVPLAGQFTFADGMDANIKFRCKIGKPSDVVAVVHAGGKVYTHKVHVKVTKGGC